MLTPKQEKFVRNLVKGMSQREAYKKSYNAENMQDDTIDKRASEIFAKGEIKGRYNELISKLDDKAIMSAKDRMKWLSKVVEGKQTENNGYEADITTKIKALDTLNKMDNSYQQNINVNGTINNPYTKLTEEELKKLAGE